MRNTWFSSHWHLVTTFVVFVLISFVAVWYFLLRQLVGLSSSDITIQLTSNIPSTKLQLVDKSGFPNLLRKEAVSSLKSVSVSIFNPKSKNYLPQLHALQITENGGTYTYNFSTTMNSVHLDIYFADIAPSSTFVNDTAEFLLLAVIRQQKTDGLVLSSDANPTVRSNFVKNFPAVAKLIGTNPAKILYLYYE